MNLTNVVQLNYLEFTMEKLKQEILEYAVACGVSPTTVVQNAGAGGGHAWARWVRGGNCNVDTAEKVRNYMANNPPPVKDEAAA